jgi:hypothetical protein
MAKRSDLLKNSNYLADLTGGIAKNKPVEETVSEEVVAPTPEPEVLPEAQSKPKKEVVEEPKKKASAAAKKVEEEGLPKKTAKQKETAPKRISLSISSDKRRTAGFHIFPEYENAIEEIKLEGRYPNKGMALEMLVDFYLSHISESRREDILKRLSGTKESEW